MQISIFYYPNLVFSADAWKRSQRKIRPARQTEVVDIGAKFGVSLGSGSDSSDAEFAPEEAELDSEGMGSWNTGNMELWQFETGDLNV